MATVFHGFVDEIRVVNERTGEVVETIDVNFTDFFDNEKVDDLLWDFTDRISSKINSKYKNLYIENPKFKQIGKDVVSVRDTTANEDGNIVQFDILIEEQSFPLEELIKRNIIGLNRDGARYYEY